MSAIAWIIVAYLVCRTCWRVMREPKPDPTLGGRLVPRTGPAPVYWARSDSERRAHEQEEWERLERLDAARAARYHADIMKKRQQLEYSLEPYRPKTETTT